MEVLVSNDIRHLMMNTLARNRIEQSRVMTRVMCQKHE